MTLALVGVASCFFQAGQDAWAFPKMAVATKAACVNCHTNPAGGAALTDVGTKYEADASAKAAMDAAGADYVGSKKCGLCHRAYATAWAETPHAKAFALLQSADDKKVAEMAEKLGVKVEGKAAESPACVGCHVTGMGLPGGYTAGAENAELLTNVTCEACHGPGSLHVKAAKADKKAMINGAVSEKMCMQCHTKEMSPDFDFAKYVEKGVHKVAKTE
jgi:nitrate/TMAO reductase-like tetraheme cytochrome c subunit